MVRHSAVYRWVSPIITQVSGYIAYLAPDRLEVGRERFELLSRSGGFTLRAFCEIDEIALTRDVTLAMNRAWRPLDGFCRITKNGRRDSALWFDVTEKAVRLDGWIGGARTRRTTFPLSEPLAYLGLHPLQGDALIVNARGTDLRGEYVPIASVTNSVSTDGDEAPGLRPITIDVAYVGEEDVMVLAGTFAARHFRLRWQPSWPPADLWVRQQDCVFLKMEWAHVPITYELAELSSTAQIGLKEQGL